MNFFNTKEECIRKFPWKNGIALLFILVAILITFASLVRLCNVSIDHLKAPHDIVFESHNVATIKSICQGVNIYSPNLYADSPFIITVYNPLYHYLVAALPAKAENPFFTGRLLSLISLVLCSLLFLKVGGSRKILTIAIIFIGWVFLIPIIVKNAAYIRVDNLALFLSLLAVALLDEVDDNYFLIILSSILAFMAFTVKQSFISATCAGFIYLLCRDKRSAKIFLTFSLCLYVGFALFAQIVFGSGYWFSAYLSLAGHPMSLNLVLNFWYDMLADPLFSFLVILTLFCIFEAVRLEGLSVFWKSQYLTYLILATLILLCTIGKVGAGHNYFFEFIFACFFWILFFFRTYWEGLKKMNLFGFIAIIILIFFSISELRSKDAYSYSYTDKNSTQYRQKIIELAAKEVEELGIDKEKIIVLNTHALLYSLFPKAYLNDPFNYWLMWNKGILDIEPLLQAIKRKQFSAVLIVATENPYSMIAMTYFPEGSATKRFFEIFEKYYYLKKSGVLLYFLPK